MRPTLARASSAASGFRFCGMIEDPVVKASDRRTRPKPVLIQRTISSANLEIWVAQMVAAAMASRAKSRADTLSSELAVGAEKPSAVAVIWRSIGNDVPAKAAA